MSKECEEALKVIPVMAKQIKDIHFSLHGDGNGAIGAFKRLENVEAYHDKYASTIRFWAGARGFLKQVSVLVVAAGILGAVGYSFFLLSVHPMP